MALSGSFSGSILSGNYKLRVDWSATQNISNNTSKITATMYLVQASSWGLGISSRSDNKITINGTAYTWSSYAISNGGGKTTKLATVTSGNIAHNADGTKSVTISAVFELNATISGTYRDTITASATVTLNTIPRATTPTLSKSSVDMGSAVTINLPRASSNFTHDLTYDLVLGNLSGSGGVSEVASGTITTGAGTSYSWTVPDLASKMPDDTQATAVIQCKTKNGSSTVGTKTVYLTVKVPASVVPPAPTLAISEATSGLADQFGAYIQNKSKLAVSVAATGIKGSTITTIQTTMDGKVYTGSSFTSYVVKASGTVKLVTKVKDSRGRWSSSVTTTVNVLAYSTPQVNTMLARRVDDTGAADEQGEYISVQYKYSVTALNNKNTATMTLEYKKSIEDTWSTLLTGTDLSANTTAKPTTPTFSVDSQYDVRLTVVDWFGSTRRYTTTLPSGAVILDLLANGKGLCIGGVAEQEGFSVRWDHVDGVTKSAANYTGCMKVPGGPLFQWGTVSITPTANTPTEASVSFPVAFSSLPLVTLTVVSSVPEKCSLGVKDRATGSVTVVLTRTDTTVTTVNWLAIGPG